MKIFQIKVDEIPDSCGECMFMKYITNWPKCCALPEEINDISGSPYDMKYRRSDCPLENGEENGADYLSALST